MKTIHFVSTIQDYSIDMPMYRIVGFLTLNRFERVDEMLTIKVMDLFFIYSSFSTDNSLHS